MSLLEENEARLNELLAGQPGQSADFLARCCLFRAFAARPKGDKALSGGVGKVWAAACRSISQEYSHALCRCQEAKIVPAAVIPREYAERDPSGLRNFLLMPDSWCKDAGDTGACRKSSLA